jgi:hypothetical protein
LRGAVHFTMDNPIDLREQARQWRRQARSHSAVIANALIGAAEQLEAKADRADAASRKAGSVEAGRPEQADAGLER